ncbi:SLC13 family permease [Bifidobacterium avesanii]|uniref:Anion transporter n=1 Tax=Bifidobacterium avesanii TaxID=1798157 RepID=A0A7K3TG63_9BIFI|nr:SLC13 family permease [Bifidobacterium avesanii]KAB8291451.1 anion transporter [Bifidobacterium avesanii]NEG77916.1 anion transporter [Bifidobacterium avesanii]
MRRWLVTVLKRETVLIVATVLAIVSCFIVPPDAEYAGYIHTSTIAQLVSLMVVVCGMQRIGLFRIIGSRLLRRVSTARGLVLVLVALPFLSAMLITNDVALVTFVPFAIAVLIMAGLEDRTILVATLMTVAANVGSMLTPIGNAHNLYLKALTGMPTLEFIGIMAPYSALAAALIVAGVCLAFDSTPVGEGLGGLDGNGIERGVLAPERGKHQPDEIRLTGYGAGHGGWRTPVYAALFVVCLLAVGDVLPLWAMCAIVAATFLVTDRRVFRYVDWGLPLTFCAFFVFIGNMKRVPEFAGLAASLVGDHPLEVAIASSQVISNVPTTLLLSGFCDQWRPLIIGTNLGGMGTLIASMASLISYKGTVAKYPDRKGRYLAVYTGVNVLFVAALLALSWVIEP